jgi:hypothetical protein
MTVAQEIHIFKLEYIFGIWDWGLANSFTTYFSKYEQLKCFVETFTPYNQILIFGEQFCMSNMDQAQINIVYKRFYFPRLQVPFF